MVLEYCEGGPLDKWLTSYKGKRVDEQVMDKLYQFSIGIAKGMEYLASKKVKGEDGQEREIIRLQGEPQK